MDADAKKTALRMIPYGIYVLTADDGKGNVAAATVNWVTQTAFAPPLVVVGVKTDAGAYGIIKSTKNFALNMLGKEQRALAFTFFKPAKLADGKCPARRSTRAPTARRSSMRRSPRSSAKSRSSSSRATTTSSSAKSPKPTSPSRSRAGRMPRSWR